jgi:hypothetical protein
LIREIPVAKGGTWLATVPGKAFTNGVVASEYEDLRKQWAIQTANPTLKAAAEGVLKMGKRG